MASRDLTQAFIERRNAAIRKRSKDNGGAASAGGFKKLTAGGGGGGGGSNANYDLMLTEEDGIQMGNLNGSNSSSSSIDGTTTSSSQQAQQNQLPIPQWVDDVNAVERCLLDIRREMDTLHNMHAQRVGSVFGKDLANMEGRIEALTRDITDTFRMAERHLQKVGVATRRAGGEQATVGANVQRSLAKRLQELSVTFRQSQRKYLADVQIQKSGGLVPGADTRFAGIMDLTGSGGGGDGSNGGANAHATTGEFFTTQQLAVVDDLTEAVRSRDVEIIKIAQSIEELGTIFKELAVLVIDQGTILDRIDYNMEAVVEHTKTGLEQLTKAESAQKSARPLRCIICLSSLIFFLLIILVLKHRPRRGWF